MRKHTGQFYKCSKCDFKSGNKGHVIDHEETHSGVKQNCRMCVNRQYSTVKSLVNHIRRYHKDKTGRAYLQEYQGKHCKGMTVIHQCHVCKQKFKRKVDRDKHLYNHNIKSTDTNSVHECLLCSYLSSNKSSLDKHYERHRLIYVCCVCYVKLASSLALQKHLSTHHGVDVQEGECGEMFQRSIGSSLYLPEPNWPDEQLYKVSQNKHNIISLIYKIVVIGRP